MGERAALHSREAPIETGSDQHLLIINIAQRTCRYQAGMKPLLTVDRMSGGCEKVGQYDGHVSPGEDPTGIGC